MTALYLFLALISGVVIAVGLYLIITFYKNSALQRRRIYRAQQQIRQLRQDKKNKIVQGTY